MRGMVKYTRQRIFEEGHFEHNNISLPQIPCSHPSKPTSPSVLSGVAPANQTKERSVHELFTGAFRNKSSTFLRKNTRIHKNGRNSWTLRFGPFFNLVWRGDSWFSFDILSDSGQGLGRGTSLPFATWNMVMVPPWSTWGVSLQRGEFPLFAS